jgi:hypothetical protein
MTTSTLRPKQYLALALFLPIVLFAAGAHAAPGEVDLSFDPGSGVNGTVNAVVVQPDGKLLIAGEFATGKRLNSRRPCPPQCGCHRGKTERR